MTFNQQDPRVALLIRDALGVGAKAERDRIGSALRRAGATLPSPVGDGTIESSIMSGLCIALAVVEVDADQPSVPRAWSVFEDVKAELDRATAKFPTWPTDPLHALAVLGEEFGELTKAMLQLTYEPGKATADDVRSEAIQTAAMALRLAMSLDRYDYRRAPQHKQTGAAS